MEEGSRRGGRKKGWQRELNHALSLLHVDVPVHVYVHIHMYLNTIRPRDKAMQGNYTCMRVASFFHRSNELPQVGLEPATCTVYIHVHVCT